MIQFVHRPVSILETALFKNKGLYPSGLPWWFSAKESECNAAAAGDLVWSLGRADPLEEEMATHSSILAWRISRTEEPGRLQAIGSQRIRQD